MILGRIISNHGVRYAKECTKGASSHLGDHGTQFPGTKGPSHREREKNSSISLGWE